MNTKLKAVLFTTLLIICLVVSVLGWHWADTADKPFWWNFWPVAAVVAALSFIGLIVTFSKSKKKW